MRPSARKLDMAWCFIAYAHQYICLSFLRRARSLDLEARLKDADAANGAVRTRMSRSTASSAHIPSSAKRDMGSADEQVEQRDGVRLEASPSHAASNMPVETKR